MSSTTHVVLDNRTLEPVTIWEAPYSRVCERLAVPGSKARNERGALSIREFKKLARQVWSITTAGTGELSPS